MLRALASIALVVASCGCSPTSMRKPLPAENPNEAPRPVSAIYHVTADVHMESLLVQADVDIDFQNITSDTLLAVDVVQPLNIEGARHTVGHRSRIDSLLLNETPVSALHTFEDSPYIRIPLPLPLKKGERIALSMKITAKLAATERLVSGRSECLRFAGWLPRVAGWAAQPAYLHKWRQNEPADFDVEITVDSGQLVVATGELLNDRELLGMVPATDSVFVDVIHKPFAADGYVYSRLPSTNGKDTYVWRDRYVHGFDFLVLDNYLLDRGRKDDLQIEVYYPREQAARWQNRVVALGLDFFRSTYSPAGIAASIPLKLVVAGGRTLWFSPSIQLISWASMPVKLLRPVPGK